MSHIYNNELKTRNNNGHFGTHGFENMSINADRSWIMYDVYKFLMFCVVNLYNTNKPVADVIRYIYKFFNYKDDLEKLNKQQKYLYYSIPYTEDTYNLFTIDKLIKHIKSNKSLNFDFISKERNSEQLLKCEDLCIKKEDLYNKIMQNQE